jgi:hypothetical protein
MLKKAFLGLAKNWLALPYTFFKELSTTIVFRNVRRFNTDLEHLEYKKLFFYMYAYFSVWSYPQAGQV